MKTQFDIALLSLRGVLAGRLIRRTAIFCSLLREAVSISKRDFTEENIGKSLFLLSIPMVFEMMMHSLFGAVNLYWVAHLGKEQAAAVGITEFLLTIVFAVAAGMGIATTAMIARRIGEQDTEAAARVAVQAIILGMIVALPIGLTGNIFHSYLFGMMNAGAGVSAVGSGYISVMFGTNFIIILCFLLNAVFRGTGDATIAMRSLWIGNTMNLVLDPCLIFGLGPFPELGLTGSAIATTIGRSCGVGYQFYRLLKKDGRLVIKLHQIECSKKVMRDLLRLSMGATMQMLIPMAAWVFTMSIVGRFGVAAQAGYTIAIRIVGVAQLPSYGMSNAAATLVGQNLGAGKPERAAKSAWHAGHINAIFLCAVSFAIYFFVENLVGFFTDDSDAIRCGADAIRYISLGYVFYGYGMVMTRAFNGAGDTLTPTILNFICFWILQIPLAYCISKYTPLGVNGVFLAITISESILAALAVAFFRKGRWKNQEI